MGQAAAKEKPPTQTEMTVGEILRRSRMHYQQSIEDIERALRIRASQIEAIENNRFDLLPGPVYAIGFIRSYSEYLGLDGDKMIGLFRTQSGTSAAKPELHFPVGASESKIPQGWLVGASAAAAILVVVMWWGLQSHDRTSVANVPPVPSSITAGAQNPQDATPQAAQIIGPPAPVSVAVASAAASPTQAPASAAPATTTQTAMNPAPAAAPETTVSAATAAQEQGIILKIVQNSWVEIKDTSGKSVVSRVLKAGDKYFVPDRPDLLMSLGNSGGVQIEIDGHDLSPLGGPGEVQRNIPLDIQFLKKKFAPAAHAAASVGLAPSSLAQ